MQETIYFAKEHYDRWSTASKHHLLMKLHNIFTQNIHRQIYRNIVIETFYSVAIKSTTGVILIHLNDLKIILIYFAWRSHKIIKTQSWR